MDHRPLNGALGDDQASVLLAAVEQQLTRYFASISRQVEAIKVTNAEALAHQQAVNTEYQEALRTALEERLTAFAQYQHDRLSAVEGQLTAGGTAAGMQGAAVDPQVLSSLTQQFASKIDATERQLVDRLLQLEARINDEQGTRIAQIESTVGRIGAGFDEAVGAMSQRVLGLDNKLHELTLRVDELARHVGTSGAADLDALRAQAAAAANDAAIVRAEVERIAGAVTRQFDHHASRLTELESRAADELDVDAAVQAERLDELERQVLRLSSGLGTSNPGAQPVPAAVIAAPADLGLAASLSATIASTTAVNATPSAPTPAATAPAASAFAFSSQAASESAMPTLPGREQSPAAAAPPAPQTPTAPSFSLDPDVWGAAEELLPEARPALSPTPAPAPATDPLTAFSDRLAPATAAAAASPAVGSNGAPMQLTRTMTAPPPMTLVPKLPSSRTVDRSDRVGDELARLLAQQP